MLEDASTLQGAGWNEVGKHTEPGPLPSLLDTPSTVASTVKIAVSLAWRVRLFILTSRVIGI